MLILYWRTLLLFNSKNKFVKVLKSYAEGSSLKGTLYQDYLLLGDELLDE